MPSRTFTRVNLAIILSLVISLMPTPQTTGAAVAAAKPDRLWATLPGTSALPDWFGDQSSADQSTRASSQTAGRKAVWLPPVGPVDLALGETIRPAADELSAVHERVEARTSAALLTGDPWPPSGYSSSVWAGTNNAGAWFWDGSWHQRSGGDLGTSADVNDIAVSPFNHDVVVAATDDGIYITTTTQSWVSVTLPSGFTDASWNAVRWDAHTPGVVFATGYDQSGPSGYRDKPIWARSADNGTTWTGGHLDEGSTWRWELYIKEGTDVWGAGERWYIGADAMGSGDYYKRYWRSQDGGGSWEADLIDIDEAAWLNNEKWVAGRLGDAERVYVAPYIGGYYSEPLAHSSDGGDTWNEEDSPGSWPRHLEYDPTRPNNLWAAYEDGVIRSTDDAVSFSTAYTNTTELRSLAIDGYTGRIYAGGLAGGAFDDFIYWDEGDTSWTEPGKIPSPADSSTTIWALSAPQPPYLDDAMLANQECPFCTAYDAHNHAGDPIDTRNGSFTHNQPAFSLPVLGGALDFRLTYVSQAADVYTTTMGYGWTHNQEVGLSFPYGITGPVVLQGHGGSRLVFGNDGDGTFSPTPGLRAALTRLGATSPHTYVITATTQHVYTFDDDGLPLSIQDPQGNVTTYEHDASDRLESVIGPSSDTSEERILTFSYDAQDRLTGVSGLLSGTTALSYSVSLGYDASGDLNVFTDTRGLAWTYTYIGSHLLQKITDPNANDVMQNVYDDRDRVVEQEDPLGESLYLEYTLADTTIVTDALGRVTVDSYDERGTWAGTTLPDSNVITRSYDANLNLGLSVDAAGNETSYDWSSGGYDLETVTDAMGEETQFDYDARHNLIEAVNARGYTTTYEYDSSNNPITVTDALEGVTSNTYDNYGNLLSTTDPRGHTTSYAYNAFGQRTAITDTLGFVTRFEYDALGRLITTTQRADDGSELNVTVNAYDLGDNLTQVTESYTSATTTQNYGGLWNLVTAYGYDGVGNQTSMTDTLGRVTLTEYDAADRADKVTRNYTSAGGVDYQSTYNLVTRYTYDAVGNRVDEIDTVAWSGSLPASEVITGAKVTRTSYDDLDRPIKTVVNYRDGVYDGDRPDEDIVTTYAYDAAGNPITTTDTLGRVTVNEYDAANRLTKTTANYTSATGADPDTYNLVTEHEYDAVGNVITTTDALGRVTVNEYDALNRLIETTANHTTASSAQNYQNQYNLVTAHGYDSAGNRTAVTDTLGSVTHYVHDGLGRLVTTTVNYKGGAGADPDVYNLTTIYRYDDRGNRDRVTNPASEHTDYVYDRLNRLVEVVDAEGGVTHYAYDELGNRTVMTQAVGTAAEAATNFAYDTANRLLTTTDALNGATALAYDPYGNRIKATDARGHAVGVEYDRLDRPIRRVSLEGLEGATLAEDDFDDAANWSAVSGVWAIDSGTYRQSQVDATDDSHKVSIYSGLTVTDFIATVEVKFEEITTTYAIAGLVFRRSADGDEATMAGVRVANSGEWQSAIMSNPSGGQGGPYSTTYRLEASASRYVEEGVWHEMGVVARGDEILLLLDGAPVCSWEGDPRSSGGFGLIVFHADVRFDNLLVRALDGYQETRYTYDGLGNRLEVRDPLSHTTTYTYDGLNRLIATENAEGETTSYAYDKLGNRTVMTDAEGIATHYEYDALSRLTAVVENHTGGSQTADRDVRTDYAYDALGHRTLVTDALAHTTVYTYDSLGRLASEEDPLGHVTAYDYDELSNHTVMTQALGTGDENAISYAYDDVGRLVKITYPDGTVEYAYDGAGNRAAMTDTLGTTSYQYDGLYRLEQVTDPFGEVVAYDYDAVGSRSDLDYPTGETVTYTYDALNQLEGVEVWDGGATAYGYDLAGRLVTATLPNAVESAYSYDDADRLTQIEHRNSADELLARYAYELDEAGNRVKATETISTPGDGLITTTITYTYDSLYRLTEADYSSGEKFEYVYDAVGNRTSYTATITSTQNTTYSYDAANRLVNVGGVGYTWDDLGRLVHDGTYTYTWDSASRLITVTDGISTYGFRYDGDGNRLTRIVDGTLITYTLDVGLALPEVLVAYESAGTEWHLHLPTNIATDDGTAWSYSAADGLGSVRQELDSSGQVETVNSYRSFGLPLEGNGGDPYGFTGELWEANVDLLFLRTRYYVPNAGHFLSQDSWSGSVWQPGTLNKLSYVIGNPVNLVDPSGKQAECPSHHTTDPQCHSPDPRASYDPLSQHLWRLSKEKAQLFQIPTELLAGTIATEIVHDTQWHDPILDEFLSNALYVHYCARDGTWGLDFAKRFWDDFLSGYDYYWGYADQRGPGPGVANIHIRTAKDTEQYFASYYPNAHLLDPPPDIYARMSGLLKDDVNVHYTAAILRRLADLRKGADGEPATRPHRHDLDDVDMQIIYGAFRAGIRPWGTGYESVEHFQKAGSPGDLGELIAPFLLLYRDLLLLESVWGRMR